MSYFKKGILRVCIVLSLSIMVTAPIMATTIDFPRSDSGMKVSVPDYLGRKDALFSRTLGNPKLPEYKVSSKTLIPLDLIVLSKPADGVLFKFIVDTTEIPEAHSIEMDCYHNTYYNQADLYGHNRRVDLDRKVFQPSGSNQKEVTITLNDVKFNQFGNSPFLSFTYVILAKDGAPLELEKNLDFLIVTEKEAEKLYPKNISIEINNTIITSDISPILKNSMVFVPIRVVSENLGAEVNYDPKTKEITLVKNDLFINLTTSGKDAPAKIINGTTFVPIRMIAETFDSDVQWDSDNHTVIILQK